MNPEVKKLWVDALRSGKYKQGRERLRKNDEFCCLGVLCELSCYEYIGSNALLPEEVKHWAGLDSVCPYVNDKDLTLLNDTGYTFERIATLIEEHL